MTEAPRSVALDPPPPAEAAAPSRRLPLVPFVLLLATVLVPTLFWYSNSFARRLDDERLRNYLRPEASATETQHALNEITRRLDEKRAPLADEFYGLVAALERAAGPEGAEKRKAAAWAMQFDPQSETFRAALLKLANDPEPLVAWNAATSLARHGSAAARPALLAMLAPFEVKAPVAGTFRADARLEETLGVGSGGRLGRIDGPRGPVDLPTPVPGRVTKLFKNGETVAVGDTVALLAPSQSAGMNALAALALPGVGRPEDAAAVDAFAKTTPDLQPQVAKQIEATKAALRGDRPTSR